VAETEDGNWRDSYQQALLELDPARLSQKVLDAEAAIFRRLQQLSVDGQAKGVHKEERMAINDAIANLRVLQQEKLQFPGWKSA
jgi:hypothetical protein